MPKNAPGYAPVGFHLQNSSYCKNNLILSVSKFDMKFLYIGNLRNKIKAEGIHIEINNLRERFLENFYLSVSLAFPKHCEGRVS